MKLIGRQVLFDYALRLNAADIEKLIAIVAAVVNDSEFRNDVASGLRCDVSEITTFLSDLRDNLMLAEQQIELTRKMFAGGPENVRMKSSMRGIDIPTRIE